MSTTTPTTTTPPTTTLAAPAPTPAPLLSLYDLLVAVLTLGQGEAAPAPDLSHLKGLKLEALSDASPASHLLATTFLDLLTHARQRRQQKKRANGGRRAERGNRLDLYQHPYPPAYLNRLPSGDVCLEVFERLEQAVRLAVQAGRSYERQRACWREQHRGLALLLLRVHALCERLCSPTGGWFLLICLKWLLEVLWEAFFGQRVPAALKERLEYTVSPLEAELACSFLVGETLKGDVPPVPFVAAVSACLEQMKALAVLLAQAG
jgi:hypothetical protein